MSKGSRPRPYSVSQSTFGNNYDTIFGKKEKKMSEPTKCGCGRSLTGFCVGWHSLDEDEYQRRLAEHMERANQENARSGIKDSTQGG